MTRCDSFKWQQQSKRLVSEKKRAEVKRNLFLVMVVLMYFAKFDKRSHSFARNAKRENRRPTMDDLKHAN